MSLIGRNLVDVIRDMNYSQQKFIILKYYKAPFRIESFALYDYELNSDKVFVIYNEENNGRKCKWSLGNPEWRGLGGRGHTGCEPQMAHYRNQDWTCCSNLHRSPGEYCDHAIWVSGSLYRTPVRES